MTTPGDILIDGLRTDEWRAMPLHVAEALILTDRPIVFRIGSAEALAQFGASGTCLQAGLAHIEGGGEGVLPALWILIEEFAAKRGFETVQWSVHAARCANPNPKLLRVLHKRGFALVGPAGAETYQLIRRVPTQPSRS